MSQPTEDYTEDVPMAEDIETPDDASSALDDGFVPPTIAEHMPELLAGSSYEHFSPLPEILRSAPDTECVMGIDEAGRGPVLGPMVYAAVYLPIADEEPLLRDAHGFADSKALTPAVRARLMRALCSPASDLRPRAGYCCAALSARSISASMQSCSGAGGGNLNAQATAATVALVRGVLDRGVRVASLVVDALGPPAAHAARLRAAFPEIGSVVVENKADSIYAVVGAASVVAKVSRDEALEAMWRARGRGEGEGMGWGSGYPSDGRCTGWMRREMDPVFGWGNECRFSWGTARDMLEGKKARVKVEWEEPQEEDGSQKMTRFFVGKGEEVEDELVGWWGQRVGPEVF